LGSEAVSRHHILPPIIYTPAPPKPRETKRRRGVGSAGDTGDVDGTEEAGDLEETGETRAFGATRAAAQPLPDTSTSIEAAERRIPSTTGKLSEGTLKELLLAQEQEQESALRAGQGVDARIKSGHDE
jgi:hypothetical protein